MTTSPDDEKHTRVVTLFFEGLATMQRTLAILCESNNRQAGADVVTQTILMLLTSPLHMQLTAIGWQPLKGRDITFPYSHMTIEQKQAFRELVGDGSNWHSYEHALVLRRRLKTVQLEPLDVLEALCASVLASTAYPDKRMRVAICNILLQRVQASVPIERSVQTALNAKLFTTGANPPGTPRNPQQ
jgi:hypothetical protein